MCGVKHINLSNALGTIASETWQFLLLPDEGDMPPRAINAHDSARSQEAHTIVTCATWLTLMKPTASLCPARTVES